MAGSHHFLAQGEIFPGMFQGEAPFLFAIFFDEHEA
jgi:hypothetical protein